MLDAISVVASPFRFRRALIGFLAAYAAITALAFGLYLMIAALMGGTPRPAFDLRRDPAYQLAERLYPLLNLAVWGAAAWLTTRRAGQSLRQALGLGALWLAIVLPLDLVAFVLVPNPLSVSARDFYVGQFPWIYLTYGAVVTSPALIWLVRSQARSSWRCGGD